MKKDRNVNAVRSDIRSESKTAKKTSARKSPTSAKKSPAHTARTMIALGAGMAAIGAATYYFFGPDNKHNQKKLKGWMIKMKGEVVENIENAKEMSENTYKKIIDTVSATYRDRIDTDELAKFVGELKGQWHDIVKTAKADLNKIKKTLK